MRGFGFESRPHAQFGEEQVNRHGNIGGVDGAVVRIAAVGGFNCQQKAAKDPSIEVARRVEAVPLTQSFTDVEQDMPTAFFVQR